MLQNRTRELAYLDQRYARPGAEFVVLYGRRRVGKTTLMYEWSQGKAAIFFFATRLPSHVLLREFSLQVAQALNQPSRSFPDWTSVFLALADLARAEKFIIVIDEYPYLAASVPGLSTLLQRAWDTTLQHTNLFLCLTGSIHSVMRRESPEPSSDFWGGTLAGHECDHQRFRDVDRKKSVVVTRRHGSLGSSLRFFRQIFWSDSIGCTYSFAGQLCRARYLASVHPARNYTFGPLTLYRQLLGLRAGPVQLAITSGYLARAVPSSSSSRGCCSLVSRDKM